MQSIRAGRAAAGAAVRAPDWGRGTYSAAVIGQAELHWGFRRIVQLLARRQPLLLVFEDLHWAEPTLLNLLRFLVADNTDAPLLVVATARPELGDSAPGFLRTTERSHVLVLDALPSAAGEELLVQLLGGAVLERPTREALLQNAGGNPLFLEESVQMLADSGLMGQGLEELPVPTSLQSLIAARLDQLPPRQKEVSQLASLVGRVFWPGAVTHLREGGSANGAALCSDLRELERRDFVHSRETSTIAGEPEYAFKHILVRDVAYGQLPKGRRMELHMRFAEWMRALPTEEFVEIVAWHLERACKLAGEVARTPVEPPIAEAVAALSAAAEKAERREGFREAQRFYARALELVDEESEAALELRLRLGRTLFRVGKVQQALELVLPTRDGAAAAGRLDLVAEALMTLWSIAYGQGRPGEAQERLAELHPLVAQLGDARLQIRAAFAFAATKADMEGASEEGLEALARGLAIAEEVDDVALRVDGHLRTGFILHNMGELARAEAEFARGASLAAELGSSRDEARATMPLAYIKYLRGDLDEAERLGEQTRGLLERTGETFFQIQNLIALAQYALARDEPATAEERLREALPIALDEKSFLLGQIYRLLTETLIRLNRLNDAAELADAARGTEDVHPHARAEVLMTEAAVATAAGDPNNAARDYEEAIALLEDLGWPIELATARIAYGRTLGHVGRLDSARKEFQAARETFERVGATGLLVHVEQELAHIPSGAGDQRLDVN